MSVNGGTPEKTLFGTNFDSNKLLTKIDYTDFYNGKWNERQSFREGLKHGKILSMFSSQEEKKLFIQESFF